MRNDSIVQFPSGSREVEGARIALVAANNALFEGLVRVIESRIPASRVLLVERPPEVSKRDPSIRLVLLHGGDRTGLSERVRACRAAYPEAAIGIVTEHRDLEGLESLFQQRLVQGLLLLSFRLDVWLAAVSLLLSGGEYYPYMRDGEAAPATPAAANDRPKPAAAVPERPRPPAHHGAHALPGAIESKGLTRRELQILRLVSEGRQNKHIAHEMALSEHTVKVHVHNLITKLQVTNRTQAAAAFRNFDRLQDYRPPVSGGHENWTPAG